MDFGFYFGLDISLKSFVVSERVTTASAVRQQQARLPSSWRPGLWAAQRPPFSVRDHTEASHKSNAPHQAAAMASTVRHAVPAPGSSAKVDFNNMRAPVGATLLPVLRDSHNRLIGRHVGKKRRGMCSVVEAVRE